ncbi:MAG: hypothetical protein M3461_17845 [Pseudomonadota bacterium]|nr:hypothetical protein [Pseudomonadota bacterium]
MSQYLKGRRAVTVGRGTPATGSRNANKVAGEALLWARSGRRSVRARGLPGDNRQCHGSGDKAPPGLGFVAKGKAVSDNGRSLFVPGDVDLINDLNERHELAERLAAPRTSFAPRSTT